MHSSTTPRFSGILIEETPKQTRKGGWIRLREPKPLLISLSLCILAFSLLFVAFPPALAATGIGVSPGRFEVEVNPGQVYESTLIVSNEGDKPIEIRSYALDRRVRSGGSIDFLKPGKPQESPAAWLRIQPSEFTLLPHEEQEVTWKMLVPQDAMPGDYVGVLFFEHTPEARPGTVSIGGRVGAVVSIRVAGQVVVSGDLEDFRVLRSPIAFRLGLFGKRLFAFSWAPPFSLFETGPVRIVASFKNTGTVRLPVTGEVIIKDVFGRTVRVLSSQEPLNVYPRDVDSMTLLLEEVPAIGRFVAAGRFSVGDKEVTSRTVFYVFPVKKVLSAVLLGVGVWLLIKSRRRPRGTTPEGAKRAKGLNGRGKRVERVSSITQRETMSHLADREAPRTGCGEREAGQPRFDRIPSRGERKRRKHR